MLIFFLFRSTNDEKCKSTMAVAFHLAEGKVHLCTCLKSEDCNVHLTALQQGIQLNSLLPKPSFSTNPKEPDHPNLFWKILISPPQSTLCPSPNPGNNSMKVSCTTARRRKWTPIDEAEILNVLLRHEHCHSDSINTSKNLIKPA